MRKVAVRRFKWRFRFQWAGVVCLTLAVLAGTYAAYEARETYLLRHRGETASATVVGDHAGWDHTGITLEFVTSSGNRVRGVTTRYQSAEVGDRFPVLYDPAKPSGRLQLYGTDYSWVGLATGGAIAFLLLAGFVFFREEQLEETDFLQPF
ncbi:DUF3592 domain-containing protein [Kribbella monticola]|uniref:DUF3592 domain-containing protein n=1 Tax=Kribbella monticola TaxID=2185285 RepID=UPI000DD4EA3A|nr:DUF3592 domain-containing protein [Kribbella monticola]